MYKTSLAWGTQCFKKLFFVIIGTNNIDKEGSKYNVSRIWGYSFLV